MRERRLRHDFIHPRGQDETEVLPTTVSARDGTLRSGANTSGCPFGNTNAFGMTACLGDSEGGLGFAVNSVKARPVRLGVRGDETPLEPLCSISGVVGRE